MWRANNDAVDRRVAPRSHLGPVFARIVGALCSVSVLTAPGCATTALEGEFDEDPAHEEEDWDRAHDEDDGPPRRRDAGPSRPFDGGPGRMRDGSTDARVLLDARLASDASSDASRGGLRCAAGGGFPVQASKLLPREPYDSIAVREAMEPFGVADAGVDDWTSTAFMTLSEAGTRCARAVGSACANKVRFHPAKLANPVCTERCSERVIVTTRGDEVRRFATPSELADFFGPIDSPDEALMLVAAAGYWLSCEDPAQSSIRAIDDGYEVVATKQISVCPVRAELVRLSVSRSGQVTLRSTTPLPPSDEPCVVPIP